MKSRVTRSDSVVVGIVWILLLVSGIVLWKYLGAASLIPVTATGAALIIWQQFESTRRTSEQLTEIRKEAIHDFQQTEALMSLVNTLEPDHPLPPTRDHSASPDLLQLAVELIIQRRPRLIVELGSGSSTVFLAYAVKRAGAGQIISIDHENRFAERTRSMLMQHGLSQFATVIHCPLISVEIGGKEFTWYDADAVPLDAPVDMLFIDGPPYHVHPLARYPAVPLFKPFLSEEAVIVLDDAARPEEKKIAELWRREFNDFVFELHQTEKGALLGTRSPFSADSPAGEV